MSDDNWKSGLRLQLEDFIDTFVVKGARPEEVCTAIEAELAVLREAYQLDPEPADDEARPDPEPSNDWPSA